jgi:hypothetical protein
LPEAAGWFNPFALIDKAEKLSVVSSATANQQQLAITTNTVCRSSSVFDFLHWSLREDVVS